MTLLPLNIFGWQMLGNFKAKQNLYFIFSAPSLPKIVSTPLSEADIYRHYKQMQHFAKKYKIICNIMCFILNIIIANRIFSAHLIYPFQVQLLPEYCFEARIKAHICLKLLHC